MSQETKEISANQEKASAAFSSIFWSAFLTIIKVIAGITTNSLGIISEALHSAMDLLAATITYFAVKFSAKPADADHPFGHGKVENLSALVETALLFITCIWIIYEAVHRLFFVSQPVDPSWWAFGVVICSLVVDINRSAMLRKVAKKHKSQALEADALHFTTDIWSSAVVLVGLSSVLLAQYIENESVKFYLEKADAFAALIVAGIVLVVGSKLAIKSLNSLMDAATLEQDKLIREALAEFTTAYPIKALRVRESGNLHFIELTLIAPSSLRIDDAHEITVLFEERIKEVIEKPEIIIHLEPQDEAKHTS